MSLDVRVIAPNKVIWAKNAEEVILPSQSGMLGILTSHAPLYTALNTGVMKIRNETGWTSIVVMGGFVEVEKNEVLVLVNAGEYVDEIDLSAAKKDVEKALETFNSAEAPKEKEEAAEFLKYAQARLKAVVDK
uniref:ATP synthase epsilon chain, cyanelle n=1 Tax=Cyanophora paradoxa TaxID=2762 RepID=ATPE_CYAPA|nr:ATP synthase CF1 epsilon subunit [Cyanophora paradoxa]P48083.1 RecName: Full=ATP synthase epsilon chain, cyanelle; AltName: Full=ATP synthase F1 sector epsilon subunit; AltName: Full=F-ATPase epsilon subunit [Cyanophora paradoxa]AAA81273.1 epsilon subunit of the F1 portion of ATP synthase [Cyanophora paradoxa]